MALKRLEAHGIEPLDLINRHISGMAKEDQQANQEAVKQGSRLFSSYKLPPYNTKLWVITEADRSSSYPEEY